MNKILKWFLILIGAIFLFILIFIILFFNTPESYPPNDQRDDHSFFKNKKLIISNEIFDFKPNTLGLFIRDYKLFKNYDTTQLFLVYSITKGINYQDSYSSGHQDTSLYYNEVYFSIDNKSYIQKLRLYKNFISENYSFNINIKDSIHNYLKKNFNIIKKQYGSKYKLFLKNGKNELTEKIIIKWDYKGCLILMKFPNIYKKNVIKKFERSFNKPEWDVVIMLATKDGSFPEVEENDKEVNHSYNPKSMGWE